MRQTVESSLRNSLLQATERISIYRVLSGYGTLCVCVLALSPGPLPPKLHASVRVKETVCELEKALAFQMSWCPAQSTSWWYNTFRFVPFEYHYVAVLLHAPTPALATFPTHSHTLSRFILCMPPASSQIPLRV